MKRTYTIFWIALVGMQSATQSFAMNGNTNTTESICAKKSIANGLDGSVIDQARADIKADGLKATAEKALKEEEQQIGRRLLNLTRWLNRGANVAALTGSAYVHKNALPSTARGLFGCAIVAAATMSFSHGLLGLFFNYQKGNKKISGLKAYACLIGSFAIPTALAAEAFYRFTH